MDNKHDFEEILLLPEELKQLRTCSHRELFCKEPPKILLKNGLVQPETSVYSLNGEPVHSGSYSITEKGRRYISYLNANRNRAIGKYLANKWIDFLALVVSVVALIFSIIALRS